MKNKNKYFKPMEDKEVEVRNNLQLLTNTD